MSWSLGFPWKSTRKRRTKSGAQPVDPEGWGRSLHRCCQKRGLASNSAHGKGEASVTPVTASKGKMKF